ncbi:hypothetical protein [Actinoplanes regularis]|uniref:hypothetical protein n=1 Tax=Actinoplanes regularis TaxID=52697 RepID=UPI0024A0A7B9|nr:hypothetical protein [Actinoplanes regularis]GLW35425.1 hypothetical protein Areg01_83610 [Actinoplanes regularis]
MADLVKDLLWSGIEDFTGLWDAAFTARATDEITSPEMARDRARSVLNSLLAEELIALYQFRGLPRNDAAPVALERRVEMLHENESWVVPEEENAVSVWYGTTEKGFERYCALYNGGVRLYRR